MTSNLLTKYGIGTKTELKFKKEFGINVRSKNVYIKTVFKNSFKRINMSTLTEKKLYDSVNNNINFYKSIKCFRGSRHKNNYPVRGQRTHTNATPKNFKSKSFL